MVFRHISEDLKERVIYLYETGWIPEDVCEVLGVSRASLYRWVANVRDYGTVAPPHLPNQGRPRKLDAAQTEDLLSVVLDSPEVYLDEICDWAAVAHGLQMPKSTLWQILRDCGFTYKMLSKAAAERDDEARREWKEHMQAHWVANQVVVIDETSKDDRTIYRHHGWSARGQRAETTAQFVRGERYSLVAAMSIDGYLASRVVTGSVDGAEFFDFVVQDVLPTMNRYPGDRSILILDNCAIHKSEALREVVDEFGVLLVFLPPYSPDFNPIEESFSALKAWIRRNYERFREAEHPDILLYEATCAITAEKARKWFAHAGYTIVND